jgi:hypothetical protein
MSYKKILLLVLVGLLLFTGCTKDSTNNTQSTWTIDGTTYTSTSPASFSSGVFTAVDNNQNGDIEITFQTKPSMDGSYAVSDLSDSSAINQGSGSSTCSININTPTVKNYKSSGSEMVTVTVNSGKVTASFSNMDMKSGVNNSQASGTIIEK